MRHPVPAPVHRSDHSPRSHCPADKTSTCKIDRTKLIQVWGALCNPGSAPIGCGDDRPAVSDCPAVEVVGCYEYFIPQSEHGRADYPVDIPIARVVFPDTVFFEFDRSDLKPSAAPVLDTLADTLRRDPPDVTVFVAGHTDAIGTWDYHQRLGLKRAQIFLVSFGKAVPIASNATPEGRARNRRVEFLFAAQPEPIAAWLARQRTIACLPRAQGTMDACPPDIRVSAVKLRSASRGCRGSRIGRLRLASRAISPRRSP